MMRKGKTGAHVATVVAGINIHAALLVESKFVQVHGLISLEKPVTKRVDLRLTEVAPHRIWGCAVFLKRNNVVWKGEHS